jgi:SAM-dependent methyltransferase
MERSVYREMAAMQDGHWWYRARRAILSDVIAREARPTGEGPLVEIGCGTGANLPALQPFGEVLAIEPDAEARTYAAARSGVTVLDGRLPDGLPEAVDQAGLLVMLDVLEHVEDDRAALSAIAARMGDSARLVLTVPAMPFLWSRHDEEHHHFRRYTAKALRAVAGEAGLKVELLSYYNTLLFPLIAGVRGVKALVGDHSADTGMPPAWLNRLLERVFAFERHLLGRVPMPFGVSLVAVLSRPA